MNRRTLLATGATLGGSILAGCMDFVETESVWEDIPVVEDRPDAVYIPAGVEEMATYGTVESDDYAFSLDYTFPHRFWNITSAGTEQVEVEESDSFHLMLTVWDRETGTVLPVEPQVDLLRNGSVEASLSLWPMLSQRMGFHYGDNVALSEEGTYTAEIQTTPVDANLAGDLAGRFEEGTTATIEFEYDVDDVFDLEFEEFGPDERGQQDAVPLMHGHDDHDDHDDHDGNAPVAVVPPAEELPGTVLGTESSSDADIVASLVDDGGHFDDQTYLLVSPRTPYNRIPLAQMSLTAAGYEDEEELFSESMSAMLDHEVGLHYGHPIEAPDVLSRIEITIDAPPGVLRHDGYETAFLEMDPVEFSLSE